MVAGGVGLAVPSNTLSRLLTGADSEPPLGIVTHPVEIIVRGGAQLGLVILEMVRNSTAEAASLMLGDIIIGANGRSLGSLEDLERVLEGTGERVVRLQFLRGDRSNVRTVSIRLGLKDMAAA
jgi:serine protease Do